MEERIEKLLIPEPQGELWYSCIECDFSTPLDRFLYACPRCEGLLRIEDKNFQRLREVPPEVWKEVFDRRRLLRVDALKGAFTFYELVLPIIPLEDIIYLGEGHTPMVRANEELSLLVGAPFFLKYEGLNPSLSFKDRGMAVAVSFINYLLKKHPEIKVLGLCASTGDTSAASALYLSYLPKGRVISAVLLPEGKVTEGQLGQVLGAGAVVIEIPGVFDDCMRIVEELSAKYEVCLLNSKNPLRIQGQKTYAFEVAQQLGWDTRGLVVVVPIGNAGNVTAIMEGFLDLKNFSLIEELPTILGVQSEHANPIVKWRRTGVYEPVKVKPSVAQAAMIGKPVSFPKVKRLVEEHYGEKFKAVEVSEEEIMEGMLLANRYGHVVCTQGGEAIAGLRRAIKEGVIEPEGKVFVVNSTSHQLKFLNFQQMYFQDAFPPEYGIRPREDLKNRPVKLPPDSSRIAEFLGLKKRDEA